MCKDCRGTCSVVCIVQFHTIINSIYNNTNGYILFTAFNCYMTLYYDIIISHCSECLLFASYQLYNKRSII